MSQLLPDELKRESPDKVASEQLFTFAHAKRDNFVDEADATLSALQQQQAAAQRERARLKQAHNSSANAAATPSPSASPASSPASSASSASSPSTASSSPPPVSEGGPIDLTAPAPRTKTIPPPRNHILTKHAFKASGPHPGPLCGFSATLVQPNPEDPACMFLLGGATEHELVGDAYKLHINRQQWEKIEVEAGGPGALFGHTASYLDGKIYVFGGLTYSSTFDFTPTHSKATAAPGASPPPPSASPPSASARRGGPVGGPMSSPSPLSSGSSASSARSAEEEDDEARRRFAAAKLAAKIGDLKVDKPASTGTNGSAPSSSSSTSTSTTTLSSFNFSGSGGGLGGGSAASSPKLVDAAGSPGGGVGHEEEDANTDVETVGIDQAEAAARGTLAWRMAAATGTGLWNVAVKLPWQAAKGTAKGTVKVTKKVGKALYPSAMIHKVVGGGAAPQPKSKSEQYGVANEEQPPPRLEVDGERVHVQLGPGAGGGFASPSASPPALSGASLLASKDGYARPANNSTRRLTTLGLGVRASQGRQEVPSAGLFVFDPQSNAWAHEVDVRGVPPSARFMHTAVPFPELQRIYVFGGCTAKGYRGSSNDMYRLDLRTRTWSTVVPRGRVPCRRHGHSATNIGHGHMLLFGGANEDPDFMAKRPGAGAAGAAGAGGRDSVRRFNDTYIFDTSTETWHAITTYGSPPAPRSFHMAALQSERYLYIVAGETALDTSDCSILDLNQMVWSRPLFDGGFEHTMHAGVALAANNKILVYGGLSFLSGLAAECFLLNTVEVVGQNDTFTEMQLKILVVGDRGVGKSSLIRRFVEDRFTREHVSLGAAYRTVLTLIQGKLVKIHLHDVPADASLAELAAVRGTAQGAAAMGGSEKSARGALLAEVDGAVLVYDQANPDSLDNLDSWSEQIHAANADNWKNGVVAATPSGIYVPPEDPKDPAGARTPPPPPKPAASPSSGRADDDDGMGGGLASQSRVRLTLAANKSDLPSTARLAKSSAGRALANRLGASFIETSAKDSCNVDQAFLTMARKLVKDRLAGQHAAAGCTIC